MDGTLRTLEHLTIPNQLPQWDSVHLISEEMISDGVRANGDSRLDSPSSELAPEPSNANCRTLDKRTTPATKKATDHTSNPHSWLNPALNQTGDNPPLNHSAANACRSLAVSAQADTGAVNIPNRPEPGSAAVDVEVCIIGAGVSGLRTAHALMAAGVAPQSIVVLEAQNRVGGRIYTDRARSKLGAAYDLGAAWFHDLLTNNVIHHLQQTGVWNTNDVFFDDADPDYFAREVDGPLDVVGLRLNRVVEEIEQWVDIMYRDLLDAPDMSLAQATQQYVAARGGMLTLAQKRFCARMVRSVELWHGALHRVVSARHAFLHYDGRHLFNRGGYDRVVHQLANHVPVLLGEAVRLIERDVKPGETVTRRHRVHSLTRTVCADYVVVAVPHSVLALAPEHPRALRWDPPLPRAMAELFGALHFDALGKVVLEFSAVWWPDRDLFEVMADPDWLTGHGEPADTEPVPFQYPISISNYARHGAPALVVQVQSPVTEYLESAPDRAWGFLKPMVSKIAAGAVPDPINVIVTDWTTNPYIRGSYNSVHVGDDPYELLLHVSGENPSCGLGALTVRFAGDHTVGDGNGCVHGAFDSGDRAAAWILDHRERR